MDLIDRLTDVGWVGIGDRSRLAAAREEARDKHIDGHIVLGVGYPAGFAACRLVILRHEATAELLKAFQREQHVHVACGALILVRIDRHATDDGVSDAGFFKTLHKAAQGLMLFPAPLEEHVDLLDAVPDVRARSSRRFHVLALSPPRNQSPALEPERLEQTSPRQRPGKPA